MTEHPIIFSAPMIRALLDGRKTQTRRILKRPTDHFHASYTHAEDLCGTVLWWNGSDRRGGRVEPLRFTVGDLLWVREAWAHDARDIETARAAYEDVMPGRTYGPYYRATEVAPDTLRWRPSIHMPRWASRITLKVTAVKVERLQDISEEDAEAEGLWRGRARRHLFWHNATACRLMDGRSHKVVFADLWESIHGSGAWEANPYVAAIRFERVK